MDLDKLDEAFTGEPITLEDVAAALIVIAVGLALAFLCGRLLRRYFGRPDRQTRALAKLAGRAGQWCIVAVSVAWALSILGLQIGWLSLSIAIALLVGTLALKPLVGNFAVSAVIASRPAFDIGDEIGIGDVVGELIEITERSVVVRRLDGSRVHIPNVAAVSDNVTVYSTDAERRSKVDVTLASHTDIDEAERVIRTAIDDVDVVLRVGSVRATSLDDVELSISFWHEPTLEAGNNATDQVIRAVHRALRRAGIEGAPSLEVALVNFAPPADSGAAPPDREQAETPTPATTRVPSP